MQNKIYTIITKEIDLNTYYNLTKIQYIKKCIKILIFLNI